MANRFEGRIKRLEALQGEEVDLILDSLSHEQGSALLTYLIAALEGEPELSDDRLRHIPMSRERYELALASIPVEVPERLLAAFIERVTRKEAA